jgi:hypothetical protein
VPSPVHLTRSNYILQITLYSFNSFPTISLNQKSESTSFPGGGWPETTRPVPASPPDSLAVPRRNPSLSAALRLRSGRSLAEGGDLHHLGAAAAGRDAELPVRPRPPSLRRRPNARLREAGHAPPRRAAAAPPHCSGGPDALHHATPRTSLRGALLLLRIYLVLDRGLICSCNKFASSARRHKSPARCAPGPWNWKRHLAVLAVLAVLPDLDTKSCRRTWTGSLGVSPDLDTKSCRIAVSPSYHLAGPGHWAALDDEVYENSSLQSLATLVQS